MVVSSDFQTGGTWAGATEAIKANWCPVLVRDGASVPKGNRELIKLGAAPLVESGIATVEDLAAWFQENATARPIEMDLFSPALRETPPRNKSH